MASQSQADILRGQNRAKRALAETVANEVGQLNAPLNRLAERIKDVCSTLANNWEGAAADSFIRTVRDMADEIGEISSQTKTLTSAIKSAALSAYPDS